MDVNNTSYWTLLTETDWQAVLQDQSALEWNRDQASVALTQLAFVLPQTSDPALTPSQRRGAAADNSGAWYWISDDSTQILVRAADAAAPEVYWPPGTDRGPLCGGGAGRWG